MQGFLDIVVDAIGKPYFKDWTIRTSLVYLLCKKDSARLRIVQSLPLFLSLYRRSLCQTLWKSLDKPRKMPRISKDGLASKAVKILFAIAISWCIHEPSGLKPDWLTV